MNHPQTLFCLFLVSFKQTKQILQQINVKNDIPVSSTKIWTHSPLIMRLIL